jgi:hypothetical protein
MLLKDLQAAIERQRALYRRHQSPDHALAQFALARFAKRAVP